MARRVANKLTALEVERLKAPGRHSDGAGLYLVVTKSGSKNWSMLFDLAGKRREMGLGPYPAVGLAEARTKAAEARKKIETATDPFADREEEKPAIPTFKVMADRYIAAKASEWRNPKHRAQWHMTLDKYAAPLHDKPVGAITVSDILGVLTRVWQKTPETASRLRGRIESVLDAAKAEGWRSGENPAAWKGNLAHLLPKRGKLTRGHHKAVAFDEMPDLIATLRAAGGMTPIAIEFIALTAVRSGEARLARWGEIDIDAALWVIPARRMKAGREHRVPLSARAVEILRGVAPLNTAGDPSALVFPGARKGKPLSDMALSMTFRRLNVDATVHGLRSTFRDWCGEVSTFPREVAEAALAHVVGDKAEQAYRRGDALEKRRAMMAAWAQFCEPREGGQVITMQRRKA